MRALRGPGPTFPPGAQPREGPLTWLPPPPRTGRQLPCLGVTPGRVTRDHLSMVPLEISLSLAYLTLSLSYTLGPFRATPSASIKQIMRKPQCGLAQPGH